MLSGVFFMAAMSLLSCGTRTTHFSHPTLEHRDAAMNLQTLALRFAPRLYLHPDEPFEMIGIIPVFHPAKPLIAYHIFFEEDALFAGRGKELDHEVVWVEYDPITLKVSDVATLWHRTVLRTDTCLVNAKASQQRPTVFIQWGQHGILPLGWETLGTLRPVGELFVHYTLVRTFSRIPGVQAVDTLVTFRGSYKEYLQLTRAVDAASYLRNQKVIVAEYATEGLKARMKQTFGAKKEWPFWSPTY